MIADELIDYDEQKDRNGTFVVRKYGWYGYNLGVLAIQRRILDFNDRRR